MGIFKNLKHYYKKKEVIKNQSDQSIPNYDTYNSSNKTIVFFNLSMPSPDKDSGSNRLKEIILFFKAKGYNCIICSRNTFRTNKDVVDFSELGVIVYVETSQYRTYFDFLRTVPKVDFVWYYGARAFDYNFRKISGILTESKSVFDMTDIHFLRYQRAIKLDPKRISNRKNYKKFLFIETKLAQNVDFVITVSDFEREIMTKYIADNKLITLSNIHYPKSTIEEVLPFEKREDIVFIGSQHEPNIDAIYFLHNDIMPIVWQKDDTIKVNIIGNVKDRIKDIVDPRFVFHGYVPDIEPFFMSNKLMVAPLRYGAGVKGKIGQAFEYYLPVVTSPVGAEGMKLVHRKNALIHDEKEEFASGIIELYSDKNLWLELQKNSEESLKPFSFQVLEDVFSRFDVL
jgi:hypothetical protein